MNKRFSLPFVWVGVIPCLLAMDDFFPVSMANQEGPSRTLFLKLLCRRNSVQDVPIILWWQGGPGCSSMTGNFYEFGPWQIGSDMRLHKNNNTWNTRYAILFVDNPVGTGFIIAEKDEDISMNQEHVVAYLFSVLTEFYQLNPSFQSRPFFMEGETYGGKYVPALGYYIMLNTQGPTFLTQKQPHECSDQDRVSFRLDELSLEMVSRIQLFKYVIFP